MRHLLHLALVAVSCLASAVVPAHANENGLQQHLRDQYNGKTFVLRNFYNGSSLGYDETGQLSKTAISGDWTVDGFVRVEDVRVSNHRLRIQATRLRLGWLREIGFFSVPTPAGKAGEDYERAKDLRIEVKFSSNEVTGDSADAVLARIFLTQHDNLAELVPDYWKPCFRPGAGAKDSNCRFAPELQAIPGVASSGKSASTPTDAAAQPFNVAELGAGHGIRPARIVFQHEPEFSEPARQAKYQGTVTLGLVVDKEGLPTNIQIINPLGCGLDAQAVRAVEGWKFRPAEKEGEPVSTKIAVEVDFHLY
ncbi:MAG: energy transducer TonB [Candidatus Sulfotelmatobacter sp.]